MVGVINRGIIFFLVIVFLVFGGILFFQNVSFTGFAVAEPDAIYFLKEGKTLIDNNINADGVVIEGLKGEIIRRKDVYALYTKEASANNLGLIELYKKNGRLKGQIVSLVDNNLAIVNGQSYRFNLNENLVIECRNDICLTCVDCGFSR